MKKIVISANVIWAIYNFRLELIKHLVKNNYEVHCVASRDDFSKDTFSKLNQIGAKVSYVNIDRKGINPFKDIYYGYQLFRIFKKVRPHTVLSFSPKANIYGAIACRLLNIRSINTVNGLGSGFLANNFVSNIQRKLYKIAFKKSKFVLFQNFDDLNLFTESNILKRNKAKYIPGSGINTSKYKLESKMNSREVNFLFVGRLIKDKGVFEFTSAAKRIVKKHPNAKFLMGGYIDKNNPSGLTEIELQKLIDLNIITFLGSTNNILDFLQLTDYVVLPSYREGLSKLLLEAASCKKPMIATNVPGCTDIVIEEKTGFLCEPYSVDSLVTAIEKALDLNYEKRLLLGNQARTLIQEKFSSDLVNAKYMELIEYETKNDN